ncbi:MAG TPA: hypothetical protein VIV60_09345 [Polyangiaceae bacterium]
MSSRIHCCCCLGFVLLAAACSRSPKEAVNTTPEWQRGDVAVVEPTAADFYESQVVEAVGGHLRVQRLGGGDSLLVNKADAYRVPAVAPTHLATSPWAICRLRSHEWVACRVDAHALKENDAAIERNPELGKGGIVVEYTGLQHPLADTLFIEPSGLTAMNIQRRFEQSTRRSAFERSFRDGVKPRRTQSWQPTARRLVLVNRQGQWFGALVLEVDKERVVVRLDGEKAPTDVARANVAPQPPHCGQAAVRGDRALRRPMGHGAPWTPVLVIAVDGVDAVVEDVDRNRSTLQTRDICPLSAPSAASDEAR